MWGRAAVVVCAGAMWGAVGAMGAFLGETSSPLKAMKVAFVLLPAGLWMLLPVPRDSFPDGVREWLVYAAYWVVVVGLQAWSIRRRSVVLAVLPYLIVCASFVGCFVGDSHKVFVVH